MGLISWIKNKYYNHKLDNADSAYQSKDILKAERIYLEILDHHPNAIEHLAKMYFEVAISQQDELSYLSKLKSLLSKVSNGKEIISMYLAKLVSHIENAAEHYFNNRDFTKASTFLKAIELDKSGDSNFAKKNRLYALYVNLNAVEYETSYETSLGAVDAYCKSEVDKDVEDAIISTVQRLHAAKKLDRAYCLANCLAKKGNRKAIKECISIAYDIYTSGKSSFNKVIDEDVLLEYISVNSQTNLLDGLEQFAPFTSKYKERYVVVGSSAITSETDNKIAYDLFKRIWETTPDVTLIHNFAKSSSTISSNVFEYFVKHISSIKSDEGFKSALFQELLSFEDYNYVFAIFEKFKKKGVEVHTEYITKAKSIIPYFEEKEKLSLLNRILGLYNDESWAIDEKMALGEKCLARKEYDVAENIFSELVGLHPNAQPRIASIYFERSQEEIDLLNKREWIYKAFAFKKNHNEIFNSAEYDKLIPDLSSKVLTIIHDCFTSNIPEEAYVTVKKFKPYVSSCYSHYITELKAFQDIDYVLAKLESLKNKGFDITTDYIEIVNKIYLSKENSDKYKLTVLSKAQTLFDNDDLYQKYISKGIEVINGEEDEVKALQYFAELWNSSSDTKLLDAFVNQEYKHFKAIIDYLIKKTSVKEWGKELFSHLCDNIFAIDDYKYALSIFDKLKAKKLSIQKSYVATVLKALPKLDIKDKLDLVNESLTKFNDENLLNEKLAIAEVYLSEGSFEKSENILGELIGLHASAEPKLASLYYKEAEKTKILKEKEHYLTKGLAFKSIHSELFSKDEYSLIFEKLLKAYKSLIDKYYSINDNENTNRLCIGLKSYSDDWFDKYAKLTLSTISHYESSELKVKEIISTINTLEREGVDLKNTHTESIKTLWDELGRAQIQYVHTLPYPDCITKLNDFIIYLDSHCEKSKAVVISNLIKSELVNLHKKQSYKYEQENKLSEAIDIYNTLYNLADNRTKLWCAIRRSICQIKLGNPVLEEDIHKSLSLVGFAKEKKELAYRFAIWLIKYNNASRASDFINKYLPDEKELVEACEEAFIKEAEAALANLNKQISKLNKGEATLSEANELANSLNDYDNQISPYLSGVHEKIDTLKTSIQSYILSKCYEEENYDLALKHLKETGKNWYEDDVYFRNVAIACLGIAETGKINKTNYKAIISCWLTAVYRDQLFVSSLDYTSWDDPYTFTLENSLGGSKEDSFETLPDNVNFDEPVEASVIAISEVQQSLLSRFERALFDKDETFNTFYEEQRDAMDSLVKLNMDDPCIIASPYLANNTRKCLNEIKKTLDYEYDNYGGENILKVGVLYNINTGIYRDYKEASSNAEKCISAANSMSITQVRSAFTDSTIESIQEFPDLYSSFTTEIQNVLSKVTRNGTSYKTVLNVFSIICQAINDNTLSYILGNFINQSVVGKLNDESLDLASGLKDLVSAYKVAKTCSQLKTNIGNVLEALVGKYITEAIPSDLATIKSVLNSTGTEFESNIANTLSEQLIVLAVATGHADTLDSLSTISARTISLRNKLANLKVKAKELSVNMELSQIVEKVNKKTISYSSALQKVYSIYKNNQDNSRVCENLCTLVGICIREYVIPDAYGKASVMTILNQLRYNKSATYKTCAQTLKNERQEILDQLPWQARTLLTGGTTYGAELNEEGRRLKNALQLYLDLA